MSQAVISSTDDRGPCDADGVNTKSNESEQWSHEIAVLSRGKPTGQWKECRVLRRMTKTGSAADVYIRGKGTNKIILIWSIIANTSRFRRTIHSYSAYIIHNLLRQTDPSPGKVGTSERQFPFRRGSSIASVHQSQRHRDRPAPRHQRRAFNSLCGLHAVSLRGFEIGLSFATKITAQDGAIATTPTFSPP